MKMPEPVYRAERMKGGCEICLTPYCGTEGYVSYPGTPLQFGAACVRSLAAIVPFTPTVASAPTPTHKPARKTAAPRAPRRRAVAAAAA